MPFTLTGVDRTSAKEDGGQLIRIIGVFEVGQPYEVHIGPNGDATDPIAVSGIPDSSTTIFPILAGTELQVFSPLLPPGGPYDVFVKRTDLAEDEILLTQITVTARDFQTAVFGLRSVLPPHYATGPRNMEGLKPV